MVLLYGSLYGSCVQADGIGFVVKRVLETNDSGMIAHLLKRRSFSTGNVRADLERLSFVHSLDSSTDRFSLV